MPSSRRPPLWVWIIATPLVLLAIAWGLLAILLPPARARELVRAELAKRLARDVRFENVTLSLFPPVRLAVRRVELAEPGGFERGTALSANAIDLDLDVLALIKRRVSARRLILESPALHLVLRADGSTNFDGLGTPPGAAPPAEAAPAAAAAAVLDLAVRELRIVHGSVLVDDLRAGRRVAFTLDTRTSLVAERGGERMATGGDTEISRLAFGPLSAGRPGDLDLGLAKLVWKLHHQGKLDVPSRRLALEALDLGLGQTRLSISGLVDSLGARPRVDLRARGDGIDLAQVLSWVSVADARVVKGLSGSGRLSFDLAARGSAAPGSHPVLTGVARLERAAFRYAGAPADVSALSLTASFRPDTVLVPDLRAIVSGQPVAARLMAWHLTDPNVDFALRGNLDLAAVAPMLAPAGTKVAGRADLDVSGRGRAHDPGSLALAGRASLKDVSVEGAGLPKRIDQVSGRVDFSTARAAIHQLTAHAGQSSYTLDATVERPLALIAPPGKVAPANVEFAFRSPYLDLAELLPTTPGAPFLPNASGSGRVVIDRLKQGKLDVRAVTADLKLSPAALDAWRFAMKGYGGTVSGDAKFDLRDTRKPAYTVHALVDSVEADALLGAWTPVKNLLAGTLDTKLEFSGAGDTPQDLKQTLTLVGLASLTHGRLGPGPALDALAQFVKVPRLKQLDFSKLELPMRIENGRVVTDPVVITGSSGEWRLTGALGFDGALDYAVSVTLPPDAAAALEARSALAAGALSDPQGRVLLDLHVAGSLREPRVSWDTNAMRARLEGRASQALAEQRTKLEAVAKEAARQAFAERLGLARDSAATRDSGAVRAPLSNKAARDSLERAAKGLFKSFFGRPEPAAPSTAPDTTKH